MKEPQEGVGTEPGAYRVGEAKGESVAGCINSAKFCRGMRTAEKLQTCLGSTMQQLSTGLWSQNARV